MIYIYIKDICKKREIKKIIEKRKRNNKCNILIIYVLFIHLLFKFIFCKIMLH